MNKHFDIIIVGGGMVGLAMAAALAKNNLSIALIEKNGFEDLSKGHLLSSDKIEAEDFATRVSAISPGNQQFLKDINCWQNIPASRLADFEKMFVWDGEGSGAIEFDAAENGQKNLGSIVENQVLRAAIFQRLGSYSNLNLFTDINITSIENSAKSVNLIFENAADKNGLQQKISARLLIGADGAFSTVRQKLNITNHQMDYQQTAFVINVKTQRPHKNTAWQRFTHSGPIAFLPLAQNNLCSVVWTIDNNQAGRLKGLTAEEFVIQLNKAFEQQLGDLTAVSSVQSFPLIKRHAMTYLKGRCALIGDAAHTIHPLAGQGVNLGFQDAACLSYRVGELVSQGRDIGLSANLRQFERQRKAENILMQEAMSGFKWLFAQSTMPITIARNSFMSLLNQSEKLKQIVIQRALS